MPEEECLTFATVMANLADTIAELDGEQIAEIYNKVCSKQIEYVEDSQWKYSGE